MSMRVCPYPGVVETVPPVVDDLKWPDEDVKNPGRNRLASRAPYWLTPQLVRAARAYHGWTLQYVANAIGINIHSLSTFERGDRLVLKVGTIIPLLQFFAQHGIRFTGDESGPRGLSIAVPGRRHGLVDSIKVALD